MNHPLPYPLHVYHLLYQTFHLHSLHPSRRRESCPTYSLHPLPLCFYSPSDLGYDAQTAQLFLCGILRTAPYSLSTASTSAEIVELPYG